jgi:hypothetical protein
VVFEVAADRAAVIVGYSLPGPTVSVDGTVRSSNDSRRKDALFSKLLAPFFDFELRGFR